MKTNTELTRAFESGEISFDQFMTTAAEPEPRKPASHYRKSGGKRAAARQGAILEPLSVPGTPAEVNATVARAARVEAALYAKVQPGEPDYERIAAIRAAGTWACDSRDHNSPTGCTNPECFKYVKPAAATALCTFGCGQIKDSPACKEFHAARGRGEQLKPLTPQQQSITDPEEGAYVAAPGNLRTAEAALKFLLAGNAYFTVRSLKTGVRYTFRVALAPVKEGCTWCRRTPCTCKRPYFVSFLSGPENTSDYTYLGMVTDSVFRITRASTRFADSTVFKAFDYVFRHLVRRELPPQTEIWHEGRCGRCGRMLTVPSSVEAGIGPDCAERM